MVTVDLTVEAFVDALAARTPTPGGGSAAACAAAMGAGLLSMAAQFAQGKKHTADDAEARLARALEVLHEKRAILLPMMERDAAAFERVTDAYKLSKDDAQQKEIRQRAIQEALVGAMAVPEETLCVVRDVFVAFADVVELIGRNIVSDVGAGTALLDSAAEMARLNVRINTAYLLDRDLAAAADERVQVVCEEIAEHASRNRRIVDRVMAG